MTCKRIVNEASVNFEHNDIQKVEWIETQVKRVAMMGAVELARLDFKEGN